MTVCDTGPLVALVDTDDVNHARCLAALPTLPGPLVTTWPCLTEAMHFLGKAGGWPAQEALWRFVTRGALRIHETTSWQETLRIQELMARYHDTPMDLADAALVAAAEMLNLRRVFTLDSDFYAYRIGDGRAAGSFEVVP